MYYAEGMTTKDATPEPGGRHTMSARVWDGTKEDLTRLGRDEGFAPSTLIGDVADILAGYIRCARCWGTPVPVTLGDLSGRPLREWAAEAEKAVRYQKCKTHQPVRIGAQPSGVVPATPEPLLKARARTRAGSAVFMEPGGDPHVTPVPEVRAKKGRA